MTALTIRAPFGRLALVRLVCALCIAVLFCMQTLTVGHAHTHDHADHHDPEPQACAVCLAMSSDEDVEPYPPVEPERPVIFGNTWQTLQATSEAAPFMGLAASGHSPPREPNRRLDASRAPPL